MRVQYAQYRGVDNQGRPFELNARQAHQRSSAEQVVMIEDMSAQLQLQSGPARLVADRARAAAWIRATALSPSPRLGVLTIRSNARSSAGWWINRK